MKERITMASPGSPDSRGYRPQTFVPFGYRHFKADVAIVLSAPSNNKGLLT